MNFMEIVRSKKAELGAVLSVSANFDNENDQVSVQGIEVTPAAVYQVLLGTCLKTFGWCFLTIFNALILSLTRYRNGLILWNGLLLLCLRVTTG